MPPLRLFCLHNFHKRFKCLDNDTQFLFRSSRIRDFLVPVTLFYLCVMTEKEKQVARYKLKLFLCVVIILFIGALIYAGSGAKYSDMNFLLVLAICSRMPPTPQGI